MLATTPQRSALLFSGELAELAGVVHRGWTPEPVRRLPVPPALAPLLGGGLPRGRVSEVVGPLGSGRTAVVYALLAGVTGAHEVAAIVDLPNAFDPPSAHRAAVDLAALLWVRPPSVSDGLRCTELILGAGGFGVVVLDLDSAPRGRIRDHTWPRLARAAERANTALIILAPQRVAGSFATLSVVIARRRVCWELGSTGFQSARRTAPVLFDGLDSQAVLVRNKLGPPGATCVLRLQ